MGGKLVHLGQWGKWQPSKSLPGSCHRCLTSVINVIAIILGSYGPWSSLVIANTLQILPDAPRAIHLIDKTDHSLHIRWVPPTDPKGHITQYRVSIVSLDDPNDEVSSFAEQGADQCEKVESRSKLTMF